MECDDLKDDREDSPLLRIHLSPRLVQVINIVLLICETDDSLESTGNKFLLADSGICRVLRGPLILRLALDLLGARGIRLGVEVDPVW